MFQYFFYNGIEYERRLKKPFVPPNVTLKQIHDAVPKHLLKPNPWMGAYYVVRDVLFTAVLFKLAQCINPWTNENLNNRALNILVKSTCWLVYWWFQGLVWAGVFCLGHDAGHGTLFKSHKLNTLVGFVFHTFLLIPYFGWRATHHAHHKATGSMERDENYVPYTRKDFKLPPKEKATHADYAEIFEETPIMTFIRLFIMQGFGWWLYLTTNIMGSVDYPGASHWSPSSPLLRNEKKSSIYISNTALVLFLCYLTYLGPGVVLKYYMVPYLVRLVAFPIHKLVPIAYVQQVMFTFLHHSDPTIPHYRKREWSFLRGCAATVDRPLLGWMGRFFFHNISHDHVAHHFFSHAPFYNGPQITAAIRTVLKDDYNYDSTPSFYALYRSFTECLYVEEEGDILFYKNKHGKSAREVAPSTISSTN